jgi:3-hydroxyisobutyrate dehydrogenase
MERVVTFSERRAGYDAPVSGSTTPAREGRLVWLVAGDDAALSRARGVLEALGSQVLHVGTGVEGNSLKLAVNAWMTAATVAMSDVLALCDQLGVDHETFVRALEAGPLAMPYELQKVALMDSAAYTAGFAVALALKDIDLAAELAQPSPLLQVVHDRLERVVAAGHGSEDLAAVDFMRRSG